MHRSEFVYSSRQDQSSVWHCHYCLLCCKTSVLANSSNVCYWYLIHYLFVCNWNDIDFSVSCKSLNLFTSEFNHPLTCTHTHTQ